MINTFKIGDVKRFEHVVVTKDLAEFESGQVHPFYSTFALGRDAEWSSRLFVLEMKEADEEGIGTFLNITHRSPAMLGDLVLFRAQLESVEGNTVICEIEATVGDRLIAACRTGQKIIKKEKLAQIIGNING